MKFDYVKMDSLMASALDLILVDDVEHLGKAGELVKVRPGYARNFLLPRGLAHVANRFTLAEYEVRKAKLEEEAQQRREKAEQLKAKLDEQFVKIEAKAGESGKLFGAITKENVCNAVEQQLSTKISKDQVDLKTPIRAIGDFEVKLNLAAQISATIIVKVQAI
jgi:large subunit ribosomal protein L9